MRAREREVGVCKKEEHRKGDEAFRAGGGEIDPGWGTWRVVSDDPRRHGAEQTWSVET
jgi:hypothetical protein